MISWCGGEMRGEEKLFNEGGVFFVVMNILDLYSGVSWSTVWTIKYQQILHFEILNILCEFHFNKEK